MIYDNGRREKSPWAISPGEAFNARWSYSAHRHLWCAKDPQGYIVDLEEPFPFSSRYLWSKHNA